MASIAIRGAVVLVPLVASFVFSWWASKQFPPDELNISIWVWWVGIAVISVAVMIWCQRLMRRLLPMAALLKLSLVFPDEAPSRFKASLRRQTTKQLADQLEHHKANGSFEVGQTYGGYLLEVARAINEHDRLTRGHSERVRAYSDMIAEELGLDEDDRTKLSWAALLHDAGKLDVPTEILNSPDRPTDEEWAILQTHPEAGVAYLEPLEPWLGPWLKAAPEHHLRWDGNGYPANTSGLDISLAGRIVAVADAYDCMTSVRSYKAAMSPEDGRAEIARCAGSQFDPVVTRAFLNVSLGRLRLGATPISWLGHTFGLETVPVVGAPAVSAPLTAAAGVVSRSVVGLGLSLAALTAADVPEETPPPAVAFAEEVVPSTFAPTTVAPTTAAPTTTAVSSSAPPSTVTTTTTDRSVLSEFLDAITDSTMPSTTTTMPTGPVTTFAPPPTATSTITPAPSTTVAPPTTTSTPPTTTATPGTNTTTTTITTTTTSTTTTSTTVPPDQPSLNDDYVTAEEGKDENIKVLDNDGPTSGDFDEDTLRIISPPSNAAEYRVHNDHIHYEANEGYVGPDQITYEVCNTAGGCSQATIYINVIED